MVLSDSRSKEGSPSTSFVDGSSSSIIASQATGDELHVDLFASAAKEILQAIPGEDPERDGLAETPRRFAKAFSFFTQGYGQTPEGVVGDAIFQESHEEIVVVKDIDVYSLCEHHLIPFFGKAHIAYKPDTSQGVIGLSKLGRIVDIFARRLQVQERLTSQIMQGLQNVLQSKGVGVILECRHMCMEMRGVQKTTALTITKSRCGVFLDEPTFANFMLSVGFGQNPNVEICRHCLDCTGASVLGAASTEQQTGISSFVSATGTERIKQDADCSEQCSDLPDEEDIYRLYLSCADEEFASIVKVIQESTKGPFSEQEPELTILDIGAGNGRVLKTLRERKCKISHYSAFEMNRSLCDELQATVQGELLGLDGGNALIRNDAFSEKTTIAEAGGCANLVLLSHSLYGATSKMAIVDHALDFVALGGVLLIIHRWTAGGTLDEICEHLCSRSILHEFCLFDVELDLSHLDAPSRLSISKYIKAPMIAERDMNAYVHTLGCIAVEPHSCNLGDKTSVAEAIESARSKVNYVARGKNPAAVVTPTTVTGIKACLRAAALRSYGFRMATIIGGGHSGNCFANDTISIDMKLWNHVIVDPCKLSVRVGGGATIGDITAACEKYGLAVPLGDRPGVGMGLVLQGGLNHLMRLCGLACDNILRVVYINPSGDLETADSSEALLPFCGAGNNFGVVLELSLRTYKLDSLLVQDTEYIFREGERPSLATFYSAVAMALPATTCLDGYIYWASHRTLAFATTLFDTSTAEESVEQGRGTILLPPGAGSRQIIKYPPTRYKPSELFDCELYMKEPFNPNRVLTPEQSPPIKLRSLKRCLLLPPLSACLSAILHDAVRGAPTKWSYIHMLHGGEAVSRVSPTKTAFGCRDWDFAAVVTARFPDGDQHLECEATEWLEQTVEKLLPHAKGVYGSDLGPTESRLARYAFGQNSLLLANMKRRADPLNVLGSGCPLVCGQDAGLINDPRWHNTGVVVIFSGRRWAGKDWLAEVTRKALQKLIGDKHGASVSVVGISDSTKYAYARETQGVNAELLLHNREYKESHREALSAFYAKKKAQDITYDAKCFVDSIQKCSANIILLTGVRDGLEYVRRLSGRAVVLVKVDAPQSCRRIRGWTYDGKIDESRGECAADHQDTLFWDLVYTNGADSTIRSAVDWVKHKLAPMILKSCTRQLLDIPQTGVIYKDIIGGLMLQPFGLSLCSSLFIDWLQSCGMIMADTIVAAEASAFVFAAPVAMLLGKPLVLARKQGKLHGDVHKVHYGGSNMQNLMHDDDDAMKKSAVSLELIQGSIQRDQRVLIIDDCLASGSTIDAITRLVQLQGGIVQQLVCVMELVDLGGRQVAEKLGIEMFSIMRFHGK